MTCSATYRPIEFPRQFTSKNRQVALKRRPEAPSSQPKSVQVSPSRVTTSRGAIRATPITALQSLLEYSQVVVGPPHYRRYEPIWPLAELRVHWCTETG